MLTATNYTVWAMKMRVCLKVHEVWEVIETKVIDTKKNNMAMALLFQSIPEALLLQVGELDTAKKIWEAIKTRNLGAERVREVRLQTLMLEFDRLKMSQTETIDDFIGKLSAITSKASSLGANTKELKLVKKILKCLPRKKYIHIVASLEQLLDLKTISFEDILATNKNDKTERAIKSAELSCASTLEDEGRMLTRLDSPFVIRCYGDEITREGTDLQYNLILEYCSGNSVTDLIMNIGGLSEFSVKLMAKDILSGLRYIHANNIIHCDIKPDNLLLRPIAIQFRPNGYLTMIGDFGLALEKGLEKYGKGWGHKIVDFGVDIWAFGCTILEMLTGHQVWSEYGDLNSDDWLMVIGFSDFIPHIPSSLSAQAQDFLMKCLVKEPNSRWGIQSLIDHPFLN